MKLGNRAVRVVASLCAVLLLTPAAVGASAQQPSSICEGAPTGAFSDVRPGSTHAANIDCLAAYGITRGVGDGNYDPGGLVPRDQMTSFLINFLEVALDGQLPPPERSVAFGDVVGQTHAANVVRAAQRGIALGRTATIFEPRRPVTRGQMASFVARTLGVAGHAWPASVADRFHDDNGSTHERNINRLADVRVVQGRGAGRFEPGQHITRAQMATFLVNAAQLLADQGRWSASLVEVEEPSVHMVRRPGESVEEVEIVWDRAVVLVGSSSGVQVLDAGGAVVATATAAVHDAAATLVTLDAGLEPDEVYWLRVPSRLVESSEGVGNAEATAAFTFAALGGETDGDEDPDGDGSSGDGAVVVPSITRVETDPAADRLVVSFDTEVACPDTTAGRAGWYFTNSSVIEEGTHATGAPDAVTEAAQRTDTCYLKYSVDGVEDGDFGVLRYHAPAAAADAVTTASGGHLETVEGLRVIDTVAPRLVQIKPRSNSHTVELRFSEPVACVSLQPEDFVVTVQGAGSALPIVSFTCNPFDSAPEAVLPSGALSFAAEVTVALVGAVYDQSGDNVAPPASLTAYAL